jgi:hypothetical protein
VKRDQFEVIERHLCDAYKSLDQFCGKSETEDESSELRDLAEQCMVLYNRFCDLALPMLSEEDRTALAQSRERTHLLDQ